MSEVSMIKPFLKLLFEFLERDFMEDEVRVEVIGEAPRVFTTEGFIELIRGAEYVLPRRIAYQLAEKGLVRIKDDDITLEDLSGIVYNEEATLSRQQLVKLKPFIYSLILMKLHNMEEELRTKPSLELYDEYRKFTDLYSTLMRIRIRKLMNLLNMIEIPQDLVEKMSEEEKILFGLMRSALKEWKRNLGIERAGD